MRAPEKQTDLRSGDNHSALAHEGPSSPNETKMTREKSGIHPRLKKFLQERRENSLHPTPSPTNPEPDSKARGPEVVSLWASCNGSGCSSGLRCRCGRCFLWGHLSPSPALENHSHSFLLSWAWKFYDSLPFSSSPFGLKKFHTGHLWVHPGHPSPGFPDLSNGLACPTPDSRREGSQR